jgi:uncharacterized membrane protein
MKKIFASLAFLVLLLPQFLFAQTENRHYQYDSIAYTIHVNADSTVDVEERQTYNFVGEYHQAERYIPFKKIDSISNIKVRDENGTELLYSARELDKTNPASWGKYTYSRRSGSEYIDWYYSANNEKKTWIVSYKLHGAITFYKDKDELYWNLFENYSVPINHVMATVIIPTGASSTAQLSTTLYTKPETLTQSSTIVDERTFTYEVFNVPPQGIVTIAAGWPVGLVSQAAYWKDFGAIFWPLVLALLVVLACVIAGVSFWFYKEKYHQGRGTIIPEYEPPQNLRPAMAEALVKEKITNKAWPATIVDLAVRGYIKVTEEEPSKFAAIIKVFISILIFAFILIIGGISVIQHHEFIPLFFMIGFGILFGSIIYKASGQKDYIIDQIKDPDSNLEDYEKEFMNILGTRFSTRELKKSGPSKKREMYYAMKALKDTLYREIDADTKAYDVPLSKGKYWGYVIGALIIGFFILLKIGIPLYAAFFSAAISSAGLIALIISIMSIIFLFMFIKFNPRLSKEGAILREQWLGFKMYLETAERYRMQNLTPDLFEKYLPYAMIFGIEKKWAKTFDSMNLQSPNWYHGAGYYAVSSSNSAAGVSSFSPSAFSSSFASSLASSFSSSGGGASGGGGGAGGGGGGGGGGAS